MKLAEKKCKPCKGGVPVMEEKAIQESLRHLEGWTYADKSIKKTFEFKNYYETLSFINAAAWIAHREDHHPDIQFGYKQCTVRYSTHAAGGVTENDFICAAKIDRLLHT